MFATVAHETATPPPTYICNAAAAGQLAEMPAPPVRNVSAVEELGQVCVLLVSHVVHAGRESASHEIPKSARETGASATKSQNPRGGNRGAVNNA